MRTLPIMTCTFILCACFVTRDCNTESELTHCDGATIYGWCEQSRCAKGCICRHRTKTCKQVCLTPQCSKLECTSNITCRQSVLQLNPGAGAVPRIDSMVATAKEVHQDCAGADCGELTARKYPGSHARQFCSTGNCSKMISHADTTEQVAGRVQTMRCVGARTRECTQQCVLGHCNFMLCRAKKCVQRCIHNSRCYMVCGRHTDQCKQICDAASTCTLRCSAKKCNISCSGYSCNIRKNRYQKLEIVTADQRNPKNKQLVLVERIPKQEKIADTNTNCTKESGRESATETLPGVFQRGTFFSSDASNSLWESTRSSSLILSTVLQLLHFF